MENKIMAECKAGLERLNQTLVRKCVPMALALLLTFSMLAGCDEATPEETDTAGIGSSGIGTVETIAAEDQGESICDLDFGPMIGSIDFADLLTSTEGQERVDEMYDVYLKSVEDNPGKVAYNGDVSKYVLGIMSNAGSERRNVMLEITNADNDRWSYVLVSTKDDFAVVAIDSKKHNDYIVGCMDGKIVDQAGYLDSNTRSLLNSMVMSEGYDATMNQVRDEFFGQLLLISTIEDEDYFLSIGGGMRNIYNNGFLNDPEDFIYEIQEIVVDDLHSSKIITSMKPTYDIPDNYLGTQLGNQNN